MSAPVRLAAEDLELIAERVAELVRERLGEAPASRGGAELVDAAEIARRFGLTAATGRARADEFGAIRLGEGPRPRLRFDPMRVVAALGAGGLRHREQSAAAGEAPAQPAVRRRRRTARAGTGPELLPIKRARA
jgi:hypothetical protein